MITARIKKAWENVSRGIYKIGVCYRGGILSVLTVCVFAACTEPVGAATIMDKMDDLLTNIRSDIITLSTAAAGIGVGTGAFFKKFSMGKQDKIELGNKIIKDSIIGWFLVNGITLVLEYLKPYTST